MLYHLSTHALLLRVNVQIGILNMLYSDMIALEDQSLLDAVLRMLHGKENMRCFVTDHLITHLLELRRMDVLETLLDKYVFFCSFFFACFLIL